MVTVLDCPHDDDPQSCPVCNPDPIRRIARTPGAFHAVYAADCPECWEPIDVGDPIARRHGDRAWVHHECA